MIKYIFLVLTFSASPLVLIYTYKIIKKIFSLNAEISKLSKKILMSKKKISIFCLGIILTLLFNVDINAQVPVFIPTIKTVDSERSEQVDEEKHYEVEVVYDLDTLISIANSIGIDRVYNENYSLEVNKQVKIFYEYMNEAEKLAKNKEEIQEINKEYVKRISSNLGQQDVNPDILFYLRYSYCEKMATNFSELKSLSTQFNDEYASRENKKKEEKKLEEKRKKKIRCFVKEILLIFLFVLIALIVFIKMY